MSDCMPVVLRPNTWPTEDEYKVSERTVKNYAETAKQFEQLQKEKPELAKEISTKFSFLVGMFFFAFLVVNKYRNKKNDDSNNYKTKSKIIHIIHPFRQAKRQRDTQILQLFHLPV